MPTDPATVPLLTDADVEREFNATEDPDRLYVERLDAYPNGFGERMRTFAARIYALAASRVDTAEVERRAASDALEACATHYAEGTEPRYSVRAFAKFYLAAVHPAPAPRECVLSDGSVVTHNVPKRHGVYEWTRTYPRPGTVVSKSNNYWRALVDTGADFDALKRFAAEVGQ